MSASLKAHREMLADEIYTDMALMTYSGIEARMRELQSAAIVATARELGYEIDEDGKCAMAHTSKMQPDPIALLDEEPQG